jgi:hypothetical protein
MMVERARCWEPAYPTSTRSEYAELREISLGRSSRAPACEWDLDPRYNLREQNAAEDSMKWLIGLLIALAFANPAVASGTISYGSRAGMEVTIVSMQGLDTAHAVIRTKHTRENAIAFCRDYVKNVTEECIRETLNIRLNDEVTGNCLTGEFSDFRGSRYKFLGPNRKSADLLMAKYAIMNLATGEVADGSSASGYPTNIEIFSALCPAKIPH